MFGVAEIVKTQIMNEDFIGMEIRLLLWHFDQEYGTLASSFLWEPENPTQAELGDDELVCLTEAIADQESIQADAERGTVTDAEVPTLEMLNWDNKGTS